MAANEMPSPRLVPSDSPGSCRGFFCARDHSVRRLSRFEAVSCRGRECYGELPGNAMVRREGSTLQVIVSGCSNAGVSVSTVQCERRNNINTAGGRFAGTSGSPIHFRCRHRGRASGADADLADEVGNSIPPSRADRACSGFCHGQGLAQRGEPGPMARAFEKRPPRPPEAYAGPPRRHAICAEVPAYVKHLQGAEAMAARGLEFLILMAFDRDEEGEFQPAFDPLEQQSEDRAIRGAGR